MPPLTDEEIQLLLSGSLFPEMLSTAGGKDGIGRTTQSQLLNPNLLASIGLFGPEEITAGLSQYLTAAEQKAMAEHLAKGAELEEQLAAIQDKPFVSEIKVRYEAQPELWKVMEPLLKDIEDGSYSADQVLQEMSTPIPAANWQGFGFTPEQAAGLDNLTLKDYLSASDQVSYDRIVSDLENFEDDARRDRERRLVADPQNKQKRAELLSKYNTWLSSAPDYDREAARREYFDEIGVPGLALLPDPSEQYQVSAEDVKKPRQKGTRKTLAESMIQERLAPASGQRDKMLSALRNVEREISGRGSRYQPMNPAMQAATGRPSGYFAPSAERDLVKTVAGEQQFFNLLADVEQKRRTARGDTPFMNAMRMLQRYGTEVG